MKKFDVSGCNLIR